MFSRCLGPIFEPVKDDAYILWDKIKNNAPPIIFLTGRLGASAGGVIPGVTNLANFIEQKRLNDPSANAPDELKIPLIAVGVTTNIIQNYFTRKDPIFDTWGGKDSSFLLTGEPIGEPVNPEDIHFDDETRNGTCCSSWSRPELGKFGKVAFVVIKGTLYMSLVFTFLNNDYSSMRLYDFMLKAFKQSVVAGSTHFYLQQLFALYLALANAATTLAANMQWQLENVAKSLKAINEGKIKLTPELAFTLFFTLASLISMALMAYQSTSMTFDKYREMMPLLNSVLPGVMIKIPVFMSTYSGLVSTICFSPPALHNKVSEVSQWISNKRNGVIQKDEPSKRCTLSLAAFRRVGLKVNAVVDATYSSSNVISGAAYAFSGILSGDSANIVMYIAYGIFVVNLVMNIASNVDTVERVESKRIEAAEKEARIKDLLAESDSEESDSDIIIDELEVGTEKTPLINAKKVYGSIQVSDIENPSLRSVDLNEETRLRKIEKEQVKQAKRGCNPFKLFSGMFSQTKANQDPLKEAFDFKI